MSRRLKPLPVLEGEQRRAVDPSAHAAVTASAGTGKTQVLTARVFRLLLGGVRPETILCLTFTKAAAAEMALRLQHRLGAWATAEDAALDRELAELRAPSGPRARAKARELPAGPHDRREPDLLRGSSHVADRVEPLGVGDHLAEPGLRGGVLGRWPAEVGHLGPAGFDDPAVGHP